MQIICKALCKATPIKKRCLETLRLVIVGDLLRLEGSVGDHSLGFQPLIQRPRPAEHHP